MTRLISINEAAAKGIERLRKREWKLPEDNLKIDIVDGKAGPWLHLYSPINESVLGVKNPQTFLGLNFSYNTQEFLPWEEPTESPTHVTE